MYPFFLKHSSYVHGFGLRFLTSEWKKIAHLSPHHMHALIDAFTHLRIWTLFNSLCQSFVRIQWHLHTWRLLVVHRITCKFENSLTLFEYYVMYMFMLCLCLSVAYLFVLNSHCLSSYSALNFDFFVMRMLLLILYRC